jgi:hypothetical protein
MFFSEESHADSAVYLTQTLRQSKKHAWEWQSGIRTQPCDPSHKCDQALALSLGEQEDAFRRQRKDFPL